MSYPTNAPCPEARLKAALGITTTADDDHLDGLASTVTRLMEDYVGPIITRPARTVYAERGLSACDVYVPKLHRPGQLGTVAERRGDDYTDLTIDTEFIAWEARGSSDGSALSGKLTRVDSSGTPMPWPIGHRPVRVTDWVPGRFDTAVECNDSADGTSFVDAFIYTFQQLWRPFTIAAPPAADEFASIHPRIPPWALPRASQELLVEHAEKRALVAGYDG